MSLSVPLLLPTVASLALATAQEAPAPKAPAPRDAAPTVAAPRPNLVLVTLDTTRADELGCYGYPRATSPSIDALANESVLFERCYAAVPRTTPSHTSLLTGVYPFEHGITDWSAGNEEDVQAAHAFTPTPKLETYPQILARHGWHTGGFVSASVVSSVTGLASGFEAWSEPHLPMRVGAETMADALPWLEKVEEPFFLWVHLFDAHSPPRRQLKKYTNQFPPDAKVAAVLNQRGIPDRLENGQRPDRSASPARLHAQYDAAIRVLDDEVLAIRQLLEKRGVWGRTTFVVTADHGEGLGQHNYLAHGLVWSEQLRVPLVIHAPGRAAQRVSHVVSSIDVLPTAIALTPGLPSEEFAAQARGRNALADDFEERAVFAMSPLDLGEFALTTARWKLISRRDGSRQLFDLEKDPFELADVAKTNEKVVDGLARQLHALVAEQQRKRKEYAAGVDQRQLTPQEEAAMRNALKALGYAGGATDEDR